MGPQVYAFEVRIAHTNAPYDLHITPEWILQVSQSPYVYIARLGQQHKLTTSIAEHILRTTALQRRSIHSEKRPKARLTWLFSNVEESK